MNNHFTLQQWDGEPAGVSLTPQGVSIHAELYGQETNGILLYDKRGGAPVRLDFPEEMRLGNSYHCLLGGIAPAEYTYLFHEDGRPVLDHLAKGFEGHRLFGKEHEEAGESDRLKTCRFVSDRFDWQGDRRQKTPYEDSIYYGLHVRGFTKDASSRLKEAGTFLGLQKKIPYLKKLGVTGIVLQPIYEFEECMKAPEIRTASDAARQGMQPTKKRLNYWGYLPGFYLAPKNAYAYGEDAVTELKTLVRQLHKNSLEIILQFYFEPRMRDEQIRNILLYWLKDYHIDGFQLLGAELPLKEIALEPAFADTKLWSEGFPYEEVAAGKAGREHYYMTETPAKSSKNNQKIVQNDRFLASCNRDYEKTIRKFLKGDGGMLPDFLSKQRENPDGYGQLNYFASYCGFRLADMVSYDRKHNEANGEENRDGENNNDSWNCGAEGETRKKSVLALRMKQMKNALVMLFTAQGTPCLFMGDEWGKSSGGNNNPYCQDNVTTWQRWILKKPEKELLSFTRELISLRKRQRSLHQKTRLRLMDYLSCGYPDLSYHAKEAWRPDYDYQSRHIGMMFCGRYCMENGADDCLYVAYNMHWEPHEFALPKPLKKGGIWKLLLDTGEEGGAAQKQGGSEQSRAGIDAAACGIAQNQDGAVAAAAIAGAEMSVSLQKQAGGAGAERDSILQDHVMTADGSAAQAGERGGTDAEGPVTAQSVMLPGRSIRIYITAEEPAAAKKKRRKSGK